MRAIPRVKQYTNRDVVTAARERVRHVYDVFDSVVVTYSGGKDSSVVLLLAKEVHEERGLGPVEAVFHDEEFLPTPNIEMLKEVRELPWLNLRWQCIPRTHERIILSGVETFIRWDPTTHHDREIPEWAETLETLGLPPGVIGIDYDQDDLTAWGKPGLVALMNGVRASESLVRFRSVVNKLDENYICRIEGKENSRYRSVKPIYDWEEMDVLKFLHENDFPLCDSYDAQEMTNSTLRIGPPLGQASKRISELAVQDPELWESILRAFPDTAVQARYQEDYDIKADAAQYLVDGFPGVMRWIRENVPEGPIRKKLEWRYRKYVRAHRRRPQEFPPEKLLIDTMKGTRERKIRGEAKEAAP